MNGTKTCCKPETDHLEKYGYLFGYPIAHTLAPYVHRTVFESLRLNWDYLLLPSTDIDRFLQLIRQERCYGAAVTMPNKIAILPHLDELTPECRAVGACNTVFWRDGRLIGTNTDIVGVRESFLQNVPAEVYRGRPGLVIGGGGAARSAVYALVKYLRCETVYLMNRDADEVDALIAECGTQGYGDGLVHVVSVAQAGSLAAPGATVACVPNFPPTTKAEKETRKLLHCFLDKSEKGAMLEMCYHPVVWTEVADIAKKAGWNVILGTEAMIYQGLEQARYWTGRPYEELLVQKVKDVVAQEIERPVR